MDKIFKIKFLTVLFLGIFLYGAVSGPGAQAAEGNIPSSPSPSSSVIASLSPSPGGSGMPSASPGSSVTPSVSPDVSPTVSPSSSASPLPTASVTPSAVPTATPGKTIMRIESDGQTIEVPYGSTFDFTAVKITVIYSDGTKEVVNPEWVAQVNTTHLGKQVVTVGYQVFQTTCNILIVPRKVTNLKFKSSSQTSFTLVWDALEEAEHYVIYTSASAGISYVERATVDKAEYTFDNLVSGQIVYVKIRAVAEDIRGEYSDIMPIAPRPDSVGKVTAIKNVKTKITLQWDMAAGATGYAVYYRLSTDTDYKLAGHTAETTYQVTGLKAGKDYYFMVYSYAAVEENVGDRSEEVLFGTAPSIPAITKIKGGDRRVKVYWKKGSGAESFRIYVSLDSDSGFKCMTTIPDRSYKIAAADGLKNKKKYYVKVVAVRTVSGIEMTSASDVVAATTVKAKATSKKAKFYKTKAKFLKSAAYLKYKEFSKKLSYKKSYIVPGQIATNVAGFTATRMVPQSITFAGKYLLISAYDYYKTQESVLYVMNKKNKKLVTTIVLPHNGHVGGITYDGHNIWLTHGKKLECFPYKVVSDAATSGRSFTEIYDFTTTCAMPETVSYVTYYRDHIWAGAYSEPYKKYLYGYKITNKKTTPKLTRSNRILLPNRTQGVTFTAGGKMILSRSCQTDKTQSGFMSWLETYKPTWNFSKTTIKKNKCKKIVKMPPMNEGIAICGAYTYVIYESSAFPECEAPIDRITAFKTNKIS